MDNNNINIKDREYYLALILDFLGGGEQSVELQNWLNNPENKDYFMQIQQVWDASVLYDKNIRFDHEKSYSLFLERIKELAPENGMSNRRKILRRWLTVAAIMIPFIFLTYFSVLYLKNEIQNSAFTFHQLETPYGSHTSVRLNDGTQIWLNAGTKLEYNDRFGEKRRSVKLSGEAYFEVKHNSDIPFIIESGEIKVEVLGTRFNVNAYENDPEIKVSLLEGSIQMSVGESAPLLLVPDEVITYNIQSGEISRQSLMTTDPTGWTYNRLIFNNQPFQQILHTLERTFDVQIQLTNNTLKERRFSGDFIKNEPIEEIIRIMSETSGFKYNIEGKEIEIY